MLKDKCAFGDEGAPRALGSILDKFRAAIILMGQDSHLNKTICRLLVEAIEFCKTTRHFDGATSADRARVAAAEGQRHKSTSMIRN
jgi:hypothetical protein